jgi:hypothetical protein
MGVMFDLLNSLQNTKTTLRLLKPEKATLTTVQARNTLSPCISAQHVRQDSQLDARSQNIMGVLFDLQLPCKTPKKY